MELLSTDKAATSLQVWEGGPAYKANKEGVVTVDNPLHQKILRQMGAKPHLFQATGGKVFVCPDCGFRAVIRDRCGRCGRTDLPEEEPDAS
ncbi:MAG: hypothetical protein WBF51_04265 [Candidatus Dormiibacterota bacterium]